ncbi:Protein kinase-like domain protein [Apiospora arundinis]
MSPSPPSQKLTSWGAVIYTLEGSIHDFFRTRGGSVTRSECDAKAAALADGEPVNPVSIQGSLSYTVVAGPPQTHIVQFRAAQSKLHLTTLELAAAVHPKFFPACTYQGQMGCDASALHVYIMDKREGLCYFKTRDTSAEGCLVRFFAEAWKQPQQVTPAVASKMQQDIDNDLHRLAESLPAPCLATVLQVRDALPSVFTHLPFVLTHGDISESNILVDPDDGRITGIIDWAEAEVSPFGLALWGLEPILGYMNPEGWHYHANAEELRAEFWRVFEVEIGNGESVAALSDDVRHAIRFSRMVGLLLSHGFKYDDNMTRGNVTDDLRRVEAFCTAGI